MYFLVSGPKWLDETLYALQDARWNVVALADASGTIVERFRYDPYGHSTVLEGDFTADADGQSAYDWEYRFTSREFDSETGLHYFRARYYHDGLGRFLGRDPLDYIDGASLYAAYFVPGGVDPDGADNLGVASRYCGGIGRIADDLSQYGGVSFAVGGVPSYSPLWNRIYLPKDYYVPAQ